ncbi:MAG TPA: NAD(P)H-binding protein [Mucilaginibacter sp.]
MKITVTGSLGNISGPLAILLVNAGHDVTVVTSNAGKTADIEAIGAKAAVGSAEDVDFLTKAFTGADVVYTMVPQQHDSNDYKAFIRKIAGNLAEAVKNSGVTKVVNLSSIGAHMATGAGPVSGMHDDEAIFAKLNGVIVKTLRPASFYYNYYATIGMVKHGGVIGANYPADRLLVLVHPKDISDAAFEAITTPFTENNITYVASDEKTGADVAAIIGKAIGKPELPWVEFTDEQSIGGMQQGGLSEDVAKNLTEMGNAVKSGEFFVEYNKHKPKLSERKFEDFAKDEFAAAYNA